MSEVTTTATMAAMQQFFDPVTETFTADGTGQQKVVIDDFPKTISASCGFVHGSWRRFYGPRARDQRNRESQHQRQSRGYRNGNPEANKLNLIANISRPASTPPPRRTPDARRSLELPRRPQLQYSPYSIAVCLRSRTPCRRSTICSPTQLVPPQPLSTPQT